MINTVSKGNEGLANIHFFCSSGATTVFTTAAGVWYQVGIDGYKYFGNPNIIEYTAEISHTRLNTALSLAIVGWLPIGANRDDYYTLKPVSIYYAKSAQTLLKSDSAIGTFSWVSLDGGLMG
jgi:hypothetical protein